MTDGVADTQDEIEAFPVLMRQILPETGGEWNGDTRCQRAPGGLGDQCGAAISGMHAIAVPRETDRVRADTACTVENHRIRREGSNDVPMMGGEIIPGQHLVRGKPRIIARYRCIVVIHTASPTPGAYSV